MARGWESKSVEAQQAEAGEKSTISRRMLSPEEAERARKMESLRLSRQRVFQELEKSHNPRHRKLLEVELAELEDRLNRFAD
jgi:coproporphyrinogen III oxidase-like Fe-S oxidoreductase